MIYTTFKQWVKGRFLETGEPRKQAYSKDELALIEMGWGYGYDAGVSAEREACAEIADRLPRIYRETKEAHERLSMETFKPSNFGFDLAVLQQAEKITHSIRARGQG